ncbi:MAG TPA: hypothetical protein VFQ00_08575 [Terriglobales bacterium]|nr:hypothetical protein [Terriglobales bacterium]
MEMMDAYLAPDSLQGPYTDFYRRAFAELLCWRMLSDADNDEQDCPIEDLSSSSLGIQFGQA